jgi:hypothetical protein
MVDGVAQARFDGLLSQLPALLVSLVSRQPYRAGAPPSLPRDAGVYLFTESGVHRYIGRTRNFYRRYREHTRPSSKENSAPFAFNIAKREIEAETGVGLVGSRTVIAADETFSERFQAAKARVRAMDFRYVEIKDDPALSTVFEVYAALALGTEGEFNLFETH